MFRDKGLVPTLRRERASEFRVEGPVLALRRGRASTFWDKGHVPALRRGRASRFLVLQGYGFGTIMVSVWAGMVVLCGVQSSHFLVLLNKLVSCYVSLLGVLIPSYVGVVILGCCCLVPLHREARKFEVVGQGSFWLKIKNIKMKIQVQFTTAPSRKDVKSSNFRMVGGVPYHISDFKRLY